MDTLQLPASTSVKIIAHRGASDRAPENTLAAVRLAGKIGASGVEVDVRLTRDGRLAVLHDADTRRVAPTQYRRRVSRCTLDELQTVEVGSWKNPGYAGEKIPALDEVLAALGPTQEIFIEVKSREIAGVLAELDKHLAPPTPKGFPAVRAVVMSFNGHLVRTIKARRPEWRVLLLLNRKPFARTVARIRAEVRAGRLDGIGQNRRWLLAARDYASLREIGAILSVWTVDDPMEAKAWRERGFDYLTSNVPERMQRKDE